MGKNSFSKGLLGFFAAICIMSGIGAIIEANKPKCIEIGCDNKQASDSCYCYLHKMYKGGSYSDSSSSYSKKSSSSSPSSSSSSSSGKSSMVGSGSSSGSSYKSYDEGYDDIYLDDDYDEERYKTDRDYADGVDDAMDEFEEDW